MSLWFLLFLGVVVGVIISKANEHSKARDSFNKAIFSTKVPADSSIIGVDAQSGLAIANDESAILLAKIGPGGFHVRRVPIADILSADVAEDGDSIVQTARGSQAAGAVVGGLLLGGAGAILGGLSGKKRNIATCRLIELRIVVNSTADPVHSVRFQTDDLKRTSAVYQRNAELARSWQAKVAILVKRAERLQAAAITNTDPHAIPALLTQLAELRDRGLLTEAEFAAQKSRVLTGTEIAISSVPGIESFAPPPVETRVSAPSVPVKAKAALTPERRQELLSKAREIAAQREKSFAPGEHRLDAD